MTLQVVQFARGGHAAAGGSFSLLRFEDRDLPDVVYIEQLTSAVYLDQRPDIEHYLEVVDLLSGEALTPAEPGVPWPGGALPGRRRWAASVP